MENSDIWKASWQAIAGSKPSADPETAIYDEKLQLWIRPDSDDRSDTMGARREYAHVRWEGQIVLDVGACIGGIASWVIGKRGARKVYCYEPVPQNYTLLCRNVRPYGDAIVTQQAAVQGNPLGPTCRFYVTPFSPRGGHSNATGTIRPQRGRVQITVPTVAFRDILKKTQPTCIKMDCEGSEYEILFNVRLPPSVRTIVMELHLTKPEWREAATGLVQFISEQGFRLTQAPKIMEKKLAYYCKLGASPISLV